MQRHGRRYFNAQVMDYKEMNSIIELIYAHLRGLTVLQLSYGESFILVLVFRPHRKWLPEARQTASLACT